MTNFNAAQIKSFAKTAKIKSWWTKGKDVLIAELVSFHGVANTNELEFILNGGEVKKLPDAPNQVERTGNESCAGGKIDPTTEKKKPRKIARKSTTKTEGDKAPKKSTKKSTKAPVADGMTTLATLCEQHDIVGTAARRKLRKAMTKPTQGWVFSADEIDGIIKIIK